MGRVKRVTPNRQAGQHVEPKSTNWLTTLLSKGFFGGFHVREITIVFLRVGIPSGVWFPFEFPNPSDSGDGDIEKQSLNYSRMGGNIACYRWPPALFFGTACELAVF